MKSFLLSLCSNMYYLFIYFSLKNTIQKFGNSLNILCLLFHLLHNVFFFFIFTTLSGYLQVNNFFVVLCSYNLTTKGKSVPEQIIIKHFVAKA